MPIPSDTDTIAAIAARAVCYDRASELLLPPTEALLQRFSDQSFVRELREVRPVLGDAFKAGAGTLFDALVGQIARASAEGLPRLAVEYESAFGHAAAVDHPPYESHYAGAHLFQQTQDLADICGFYEAFGVRVGTFACERADHVGVEISFFGWLCLKEAHALRIADTEALAVTRLAEPRFLSEHLAGFVPLLARRLDRSGRAPFYCAALRYAAALVEEDCVRHGVPEQQHRRHPFAPAMSLPVTDDTSCGGLPEELDGLGGCGGTSL